MYFFRSRNETTILGGFGGGWLKFLLMLRPYGAGVGAGAELVNIEVSWGQAFDPAMK